MSCKVHVPKQFQLDPPGWVDPNGQPERVRYAIAYQAFWWNCVSVKAIDLSANCPGGCSGTPGATWGCSDGSMDAYNRIEDLLKQFPPKQVQAYLKSIASTKEAQKAIATYFPDGPSTN